MRLAPQRTERTSARFFRSSGLFRPRLLPACRRPAGSNIFRIYSGPNLENPRHAGCRTDQRGLRPPPEDGSRAASVGPGVHRRVSALEKHRCRDSGRGAGQSLSGPGGAMGRRTLAANRRIHHHQHRPLLDHRNDPGVARERSAGVHRRRRAALHVHRRRRPGMRAGTGRRGHRRRRAAFGGIGRSAERRRRAGGFVRHCRAGLAARAQPQPAADQRAALADRRPERLARSGLGPVSDGALRRRDVGRRAVSRHRPDQFARLPLQLRLLLQFADAPRALHGAG
ncbi:MAG: hypothetical protein BWZ10_02688 [candidate division BRC1 bacterium ADurb.BinA364]|nr:MAG: hypothetical protein BWZ10_02688 [candidate division BRC1 bacterium ADurb.BinA364]